VLGEVNEGNQFLLTEEREEGDISLAGGPLTTIGVPTFVAKRKRKRTLGGGGEGKEV